MITTYYPDEKAVQAAVSVKDPLLALITFDGAETILSPIDASVEHHILLANIGRSQSDLDKYFRIVLDDGGADWTFVCPQDYKGISDRTRRIAEFYKDGFRVISSALERLGYLVGINIPVRNQRHMDALKNGEGQP